MRTMKNHEARAGWRWEYTLGGEAIEEIAERLEDYLRASGTEHTDILRIRFSLEEALLRWRDRFGEEAEIRVSAGERLRRPTITMELTGLGRTKLPEPSTATLGKITPSPITVTVFPAKSVNAFQFVVGDPLDAEVHRSM